MQESFFKILLFTLSLFISADIQSQVLLNEYASSNRDVVSDEDDETPDWVELHNAGSDAVDLSAYYLSDDTLETEKWQFPSVTLSPGENILVFCSGKDRKQNTLHTNFSIRAGKEPILLFKGGVIYDGLFASCIPAKHSYGRKSDGSNDLVLFKTPSPGLSNGGDTLVLNLLYSGISASHSSGFYDDAFSLTLWGEPEIRYTLDGSEPDDRSPIYSGPLMLDNPSDQPNVFSDIRTSNEGEDPEELVRKANVIRAIAWDQGCPVSEELNATYFVGVHYTFPVMSIIADEDDFFDKDEGIYVRGRDDGRELNYNQKGDAWERPVQVSYFVEEQPVMETQAGARIHGRDSRHRPQKSLRLYAREKYGNDSLEYAFFDTKAIEAYRRILVRTTWNHPSNTLFKDELVHYLVRDMNLGIQAYQPVILFINGEYWGIHNLRERLDKHYVAGNYGADPENLDFLGISLDGDEEVEGTWDDFDALMTFVNTHDLSEQVHYDYVAERVDISNYINYQIAYLYFSNYDWPKNNIRFWREKKEGAKWKWMFFDCDVCMNRSDFDFMANYIIGSEKYDPYSELIRALFQNDGFRQQFAATFRHHLNTTFSPETVIPVIDDFKVRYSVEVPEHIARWSFPVNYYTWDYNVERLKQFALQRPIEIHAELNELFGSSLTLYPNPAGDQVHVTVRGRETQMIQVAFYDLTGRKCLQTTMPSGSLLDISTLRSGIYLVESTDGEYRVSGKLVRIEGQ